ncbi:hypothetical protein M514_27145 [Trichuris suis]|uniref:Uncharacterized protein n=1 Tax=Trichuris suis TaxID=68888 RepID=A0A085MTY2_9BILA|nr:hypothetical protein M514_27145 [Trichuris suis]
MGQPQKNGHISSTTARCWKVAELAPVAANPVRAASGRDSGATYRAGIEKDRQLNVLTLKGKTIAVSNNLQAQNMVISNQGGPEISINFQELFAVKHLENRVPEEEKRTSMHFVTLPVK